MTLSTISCIYICNLSPEHWLIYLPTLEYTPYVSQTRAKSNSQCFSNLLPRNLPHLSKWQFHSSRCSDHEPGNHLTSLCHLTTNLLINPKNISRIYPLLATNWPPLWSKTPPLPWLGWYNSPLTGLPASALDSLQHIFHTASAWLSPPYSPADYATALPFALLQRYQAPSCLKDYACSLCLKNSSSLATLYSSGLCSLALLSKVFTDHSI